MRVHKRSSAESTRDAIREREEEAKAAMILAARSKILATTLILIAHFALFSPVLRFSRSSSGNRGSMSPPVFFSAPPSSATPSPSICAIISGGYWTS